MVSCLLGFIFTDKANSVTRLFWVCLLRSLLLGQRKLPVVFTPSGCCTFDCCFPLRVSPYALLRKRAGAYNYIMLDDCFPFQCCKKDQNNTVHFSERTLFEAVKTLMRQGKKRYIKKWIVLLSRGPSFFCINKTSSSFAANCLRRSAWSSILLQRFKLASIIYQNIKSQQ